MAQNSSDAVISIQISSINVMSEVEKMMDDNKQKALAAALGQIEKQFGKGSIMRLGDNRAMDVETISTGSLSLDIALGAGGLPMGRIVEIYGPESSGKTTLTLEHCCRRQNLCFY